MTQNDDNLFRTRRLDSIHNEVIVMSGNGGIAGVPQIGTIGELGIPGTDANQSLEAMNKIEFFQDNERNLNVQYFKKDNVSFHKLVEFVTIIKVINFSVFRVTSVGVTALTLMATIRHCAKQMQEPTLPFVTFRVIKSNLRQMTVMVPTMRSSAIAA